MRLPCPFCGERDASEFVYLGDASVARPDPDAPDAAGRYAKAVYLRDNAAGAIQELWYHGSGCRRWLKVARDTRTHAVSAATLARQDPA